MTEVQKTAATTSRARTLSTACTRSLQLSWLATLLKISHVEAIDKYKRSLAKNTAHKSAVEGTGPTHHCFPSTAFTLAKRSGHLGRQQPMGRGPAQPTPFPSSFGAPGKTDGSLKRWEASSATWRKSGMRVLLLAVTAAVVGTLMLEHMRLRALSMPQQLLQPAQQPHGYAAADEPRTTAQAPHVDLHQQQQQVVASSRVDPTLSQQMHSLPVGSLGAAHGDQLEMLPRNRCVDGDLSKQCMRLLTVWVSRQPPEANNHRCYCCDRPANPCCFSIEACCCCTQRCYNRVPTDVQAVRVAFGRQPFPAPSNGISSCVCRLLLATHTRLMWYFPDSHEFQVLHEGEVSGKFLKAAVSLEPRIGAWSAWCNTKAVAAGSRPACPSRML